MENIIALIRDANPGRSQSTYGRRLIKLSEEVGEHAEAYLNVTSAGNGKGKTWDDVREEAADILIVAVDVALTGDGNIEASLNRRVEALKYSVNRLYPNYERMTLRIAHTLGAVVKTHMDDSLAWDYSPVGQLVASAIDLTMTPLPDQIDYTEAQMVENLTQLIRVKLAKWQSNRDTGKNASDS